MSILTFFRTLRRRVSEPSRASRGVDRARESAPGPGGDRESGGTLPQATAWAATVVLERPLVTEKTTLLSARGQYVFRVAPRVTKAAIGRSVAQRFGVHVTGVRTVKVPSKARRRGRISGVVSGYRKAIVTLRAGERLDVSAPGAPASPSRPVRSGSSLNAHDRREAH